jgi:hypothetical protein
VTNGVYTTGDQTIAGVKTFSDGIIATELSLIPTGTIIQSLASSIGGFIPCTNKTIGKAGSGADYTGDTYRTLYNLLYTIDGISTTAGHPFKLSAAKGASVQDDWDANKTIAVDFVTNEIFVRAKGAAENLGRYQADDNKSHTHCSNHCHTATTSAHAGHTHATENSYNCQGIQFTSTTNTNNADYDAIAGLTFCSCRLRDQSPRANIRAKSGGAHCHTLTTAATNAVSGATGATESRPKNVALNFFIKY